MINGFLQLEEPLDALGGRVKIAALHRTPRRLAGPITQMNTTATIDMPGS
jgi:hypothetical protein